MPEVGYYHVARASFSSARPTRSAVSARPGRLGALGRPNGPALAPRRSSRAETAAPVARDHPLPMPLAVLRRQLAVTGVRAVATGGACLSAAGSSDR